MTEISYTVRCSFSQDCPMSVTQSWLAWLENGHIQDVIDGGAMSGKVFEIDVVNITPECHRQFEIRYRFPDRVTFDTYERETAPGLRDEGLAKFPLSKGLTYQRTVGISKSKVD